MILASCIAVMFDSISGLFKFLLAFSSGVGLVYIGRWFWWRINAWSEISAMVASSAIASCLYLWGREGLTYPHILLMTVAGSTLVWVLVTFATRPVSRERLVAFYRKVRPYGAWGPVTRDAGVPPARGLGWLVVVWLSGTVMVLSATFSAGKFLLGEPRHAWAYLAAAILGAAVVAVEVLRKQSPPQASQSA